MHARAEVVLFDVGLASLALGDDLVFPQELLRRVAKGFLCLDFAAAQLAPELQVPVLGDLLGFGQAVFLGAAPTVLAGKVGGTLPVAALRASVDVNLAAQDRMRFGHALVASQPFQIVARLLADYGKMCKLCESW